MAKRKSAAVSMDESLYEDAKERAEALSLSTFSAYVVQLIRKDLEERGVITLRESGTGYHAGPKKRKP